MLALVASTGEQRRRQVWWVIDRRFLDRWPVRLSASILVVLGITLAAHDQGEPWVIAFAIAFLGIGAALTSRGIDRAPRRSRRLTLLTVLSAGSALALAFVSAISESDGVKLVSAMGAAVGAMTTIDLLRDSFSSRTTRQKLGR